MFDSENPTVYEKVYQELLPKLASADIAGAAGDLGLALRDGAALVPCFASKYLVGKEGVKYADGGEAPLNHRIVLAYYIMHGGRGENAGRFVPYRELPGGQDFARSLSQIVEGRAVNFFGGKLDLLKKAAAALDAASGEEYAPGDLSFVVNALPKMPLLMSFYDADEDFPAEVKVFYDITAPNFLDMECLAVLGLLFVQELEAASDQA
jgi:hypothetical protein